VAIVFVGVVIVSLIICVLRLSSAPPSTPPPPVTPSPTPSPSPTSTTAVTVINDCYAGIQLSFTYQGQTQTPTLSAGASQTFLVDSTSHIIISSQGGSYDAGLPTPNEVLTVDCSKIGASPIPPQVNVTITIQNTCSFPVNVNGNPLNPGSSVTITENTLPFVITISNPETNLSYQITPSTFGLPSLPSANTTVGGTFTVNVDCGQLLPPPSGAWLPSYGAVPVDWSGLLVCPSYGSKTVEGPQIPGYLFFNSTPTTIWGSWMCQPGNTYTVPQLMAGDGVFRTGQDQVILNNFTPGTVPPLWIPARAALLAAPPVLPWKYWISICNSTGGTITFGVDNISIGVNQCGSDWAQFVPGGPFVYFDQNGGQHSFYVSINGMCTAKDGQQYPCNTIAQWVT